MTCCCGHTKKQHDNYVSTIKYAWGEGCKVCNKCGKVPRFVKGHYENDVWVSAKRKSDGCQCKSFLNQLCRCEWYNKHKKNCDYCAKLTFTPFELFVKTMYSCCANNIELEDEA